MSRVMDVPPSALHLATERFVPERLTLAREAAGLTRVMLASRIEATASAISQFERGKTVPSPFTLGRLSLVLGVPPGFFASDISYPLSLEQCHFRKMRAAGKNDQRRVIAQGQILMLLADELEQHVEFPAPDVLDDLRAELRGKDPDTAAKLVRERLGLGLGPVESMMTLLESHGVFVLEVQGHTSSLDAFSTWRGERPLIFVAIDKQSGSRRRFDLAHELGHLVMHDAASFSPEVERDANSFASALLLPEDSFRRECPSRLNWPHLRELKRRWKVSLAALVRRAYDLGVFSEATYRRAYVQLGKFGWRQAEPDEPNIEHPTVIKKAVALLQSSGWTMEQLADAVALHPGHLHSLLQASEPEPTFALF